MLMVYCFGLRNQDVNFLGVIVIIAKHRLNEANAAKTLAFANYLHGPPKSGSIRVAALFKKDGVPCQVGGGKPSTRSPKNH